jgi:hypothetical protein
MAIEKCPDCSNEISSTAKTCPKCGYQIGAAKSIKGCGIGCGVILLIIILIAVIEIFYKQMPYDQNKINKEKIIDSLSLGKPEVICNCLSSLKFKKKRVWSADSHFNLHGETKVFYNCHNEWNHLATKSDNLSNIIIQDVNSDDSSKISNVNLIATVNQPVDSAIYLQYNKAVNKLFIFLNLEIPNGLLEAISNEINFRVKMKYVVVDFRKIIANNGSNLVLNIAPLCDTIILNDSQNKR